jgi:hypothetical protein
MLGGLEKSRTLNEWPRQEQREIEDSDLTISRTLPSVKASDRDGDESDRKARWVNFCARAGEKGSG